MLQFQMEEPVAVASRSCRPSSPAISIRSPARTIRPISTRPRAASSPRRLPNPPIDGPDIVVIGNARGGKSQPQCALSLLDRARNTSIATARWPEAIPTLRRSVSGLPRDVSFTAF